MGAIPPRAIGVPLQRVGVGPLGKEGGVGSLGGDKSGIKVSGSNGPKEEGIGQGEDTIIIVGAGVMVWVAGQGIGAIGSARFMEKADVVVAERKDVMGKVTVDFLGAAVILEVLVVSKNIDDELGTE